MANKFDAILDEYRQNDLSIGFEVGGATADRLLHVDSSNNLSDDGFEVSNGTLAGGLLTYQGIVGQDTPNITFVATDASPAGGEQTMGYLMAAGADVHYQILNDTNFAQYFAVLKAADDTAQVVMQTAAGQEMFDLRTTGLELGGTGARVTTIAETMGSGSTTELLNADAIKTYVDSIPTGISNIVEDLTPQLGGNLDGNDFDITWDSASTAQILAPNGTSDNPSYAFAGTNGDRSGFWYDGASMVMSRLGTDFMKFGPSLTTTGLTIQTSATSRGFRIDAGTAINTAVYAFRADTDTGVGRGVDNLAGYLGLYTDGVMGAGLDPDQRFMTTSGRIKNTTRVTTTYTILVSDEVVFANTDSAGYTVTLPTGVEGQALKIVNSGSSGNTLTVAGSIYGGTDFTLNDGESIEITYNATDDWY